nr:hypothetical protein [Streptoalloteichus hindustanus]
MVLALLVGQPREVGGQPVREIEQTRVAVGPVQSLAQGEVELKEPRVGDLLPLAGHPLRNPLRRARRQRDPAVAFDLDDPLVDAECPQVVEKRHHLRGQRQVVPRGEAGDPLAVPLSLPDLRPQPLVDVRDRRGELLLVGPEQFPNACQRNPGPGEGPDSDQLDHGAGVVSAITRVVAFGLRQQPLGVVVPHRARRHSRVRRQLADGQHRTSLLQAGRRHLTHRAPCALRMIWAISSAWVKTSP